MQNNKTTVWEFIRGKIHSNRLSEDGIASFVTINEFFPYEFIVSDENVPNGEACNVLNCKKEIPQEMISLALSEKYYKKYANYDDYRENIISFLNEEISL